MKFPFAKDFTLDSEQEPWRREGLRVGIYGAPGSTKSYTAAAFLIEPFLRQGGSIVIFQPRAEWHCLLPETPVQLADGRVVSALELHRRREAGEKLRVFAYSFADQQFYATPLIHTTIEKANRIIEVKARLGRKIRGTPNHRVLICSDRRSIWKRLDEIKVGDRVVIPKRIPCFRGIRRISSIGNWWGSGLRRFGDKLVWGSQQRGKQPSIRFPRYYDQRLATFLGYLCADGHISKDLNSVWFVEGNEDRRKEFARLSKELFDVEGVEYPDKWAYRISNTALAHYLVKVFGLQSARKACSLEIPEIIMRGGDQETSAFLSAFRACDGYERTTSTYSERAAIQIAYLYERIGIHASITESIVTKPHVVVEADGREHVIAARNKTWFRVLTPKGKHLSYSHHTKATDSVKVTSVTEMWGDFETIGTLVPNGHNMIAGQTPLISHNTLKEQFPDVQVIGGPYNQDVPFSASHPKLYADAVVEQGVSMIFYTPDVDEEERLIGFVDRFLDYVMKGQEVTHRPLMMVLEEAHEYAPRTPSGHVAAPWVFNRMVRRCKDLWTGGRKLNIVSVAITQRPQELHFAIRQLSNLSLYGQFSPQDLAYIDKECLSHYRKEGLDIDAGQLKDLPAGKFLVIHHGQAAYQQRTTARITPHGADTPSLTYVAPASEAVQKTISDLGQRLQELLEKQAQEESSLEKAKRSVKALEDQVAELQRQVSLAKDLRNLLGQAPDSAKTAQVIEHTTQRIRELEAERDAAVTTQKALQGQLLDLQTRLDAAKGQQEYLQGLAKMLTPYLREELALTPPETRAEVVDRGVRANLDVWIQNPHIPEAARKILQTLKQAPVGARFPLGYFGYAINGGAFRSGLAFLRRNNLIVSDGNAVKLGGE